MKPTTTKSFLLYGGILLLVTATTTGVYAQIPTPPTTPTMPPTNQTTLATDAKTTNATTTATTLSSSEIELSPQPIYQEHVRDVSETLINQTHAHLIVEGNGTLTLPDSTESIKTTSTGSGTVSIFSTFDGKETITTEDGTENATAISYEIARSNKVQGIGKGVLIAVIHTNSTGRLAPLDGMILVGLEEFQPDGRALLTYWEWQSGVPLPTNTSTTNIVDPNL
jgi:hypothetical protein